MEVSKVVLGTDEVGTIEELQGKQRYIDYVRKDVQNIKTAYIRLGFHLYEIKKNSYYKVYGYDDFYLFCERNFGLAKGSVSKCMNVFWKFSEYSQSHLTGFWVYHDHIDKKWEEYSYSQLCEMLPLTDYEMSKVTPDMTVLQIREYKKSLKKKPKQESFDVETNEEPKPDNTQNEPEQEVDDFENKDLLPEYSYLTPKDSILALKKIDSVKYHIANDNYAGALSSLDLLHHFIVGIMGG